MTIITMWSLLSSITVIMIIVYYYNNRFLKNMEIAPSNTWRIIDFRLLKDNVGKKIIYVYEFKRVVTKQIIGIAKISRVVKCACNVQARVYSQ